MIGQQRRLPEELVLDEHLRLSAEELCALCRLTLDQLAAMVEEGLVEPAGPTPAVWEFPTWAVRRVQIAMRLERDLGVNLAGAALVSELLEEIERLRERVERLQFHLR